MKEDWRPHTHPPCKEKIQDSGQKGVISHHNPHQEDKITFHSS